MKEEERKAPAGTLLPIPAETPHHLRNARRVLFFLTIYAPPAS